MGEHRLLWPGRSGSPARRLLLFLAAGALTTGTAAPALADTTAPARPAAAAPSVPGDIDGDGVPDLVLPDPSGDGNLIALTAGSAPNGRARVVSTAAQSPEHDSWRDYKVAHFGSLSGTGPDDLFALNLVSHKLYTYRNDTVAGGTAGQFTIAADVAAPAKPACVAPCASGFYPSDWSRSGSLVALRGRNGSASPDLVVTELNNGAAWQFSTSTAGLTNPVWDAYLQGELLAPATADGSILFWDRDPATGAIWHLPVTGYSSYDGKPLFGTELSTQLTPQPLQNTLYKPCARVTASADGTPVLMNDCAEDAAWAYSSDGTLHSRGKCLDATGAGTADGTPVELWQCNGGANQVWQTTPAGGLLNPVSGRCLDDPNGDITTTAQVQLWDCNGGANQIWLSVRSQSGNRFPTSAPVLPIDFSAETAPLALAPGDLTNGSPDLYTVGPDGTVTQYPGAQAVNGVPQFGAPRVIADLAVAPAVALRSVGVPGKCVDDQNFQTADNTAVELWDCNGGANQHWTQGPDLSLRFGGKCLTVPGQATVNGGRSELTGCGVPGAQHWLPRSDGSFYSPEANRCLDDPDWAGGNGTTIDVWDCDGGTNQQWTATP
ncbi:ricin-type beta-trefoil lectin domain protein [Kitasatospora sp. NPDC006697]|uniref:ricin-type beta-trefoil lectin domain protein n=1 Tax=Kitasatospora sp. NPDC006697 TaxID=3364020 RepID=UPI00368B01F0